MEEAVGQLSVGLKDGWAVGQLIIIYGSLDGLKLVKNFAVG